MKKIEVIAYHGQGPTRTFAGKKTVTVPTTLAEARTMEGWGEERTLARAVGSYIIEEQRSLRGPKSMSESEKAFKALPKDQQDRILAILSGQKAPAKKRPTVKKRKAGSTETVEVNAPTGNEQV